MKKLRSNRGATLIELIASIAVLSIVGLASFTLLMFSIRTNNFIITGSTASKDADLLNRRLELLFDEVADVPQSLNEKYYLPRSVAEVGGEVEHYVLSWEDTTLYCDGEIYQEDISAFLLEHIPGTSLVRASYTIDERDFVKIFRLGGLSLDEAQAEKGN